MSGVDVIESLCHPDNSIRISKSRLSSTGVRTLVWTTS